jgi:hypothetical protein
MVASLELAIDVAINDGDGPPRGVSQNVVKPCVSCFKEGFIVGLSEARLRWNVEHNEGDVLCTPLETYGTDSTRKGWRGGVDLCDVCGKVVPDKY